MKNYNYEKTTDKDILKVVDQNGDWTHYLHIPSNTYLRAVNYILKTGYTKGIRFEEYLKSHSKEEVERKLQKAGERGDKVHQYIRFLFEQKPVKGYITADREAKMRSEETGELEQLNNDEWACVLSFLNFWEKHELVLIKHEFTSYSLKHGFAGTGDAIIILTKKCDVKTCPCDKLVGKIGLYDWKSGAGIWDDQGPQTAAYTKGENIKDILKGRKIGYTAILRLGTSHVKTNGYELKPYDNKETQKHWKEFRAAKVISDASYKPFNPEKEIVDIPDKVKIKIKKEKHESKPLRKK